jgi:hypothetical protein
MLPLRMANVKGHCELEELLDAHAVVRGCDDSTVFVARGVVMVRWSYHAHMPELLNVYPM